MPAVAAAPLIGAPADDVDAELLLAAIRTPDERAGDEIARIEPKGHKREAAIVARFGQSLGYDPRSRAVAMDLKYYLYVSDAKVDMQSRRCMAAMLPPSGPHDPALDSARCRAPHHRRRIDAAAVAGGDPARHAQLVA